MRPPSPIAEGFDKRIRTVQSKTALDQLIREIYQAKVEGRLSEAEADELQWTADDRRRALARITTQSQRPSLAQPQGLIRIPKWIGGASEFLYAWQATKAFYRRREEWREQFCRDRINSLSKLDLRIALEISFNLNADPMDHRFGQCFGSITTLAGRLGCRAQSFLESADRLESFAHLKIYHGRGRGNPNRYEPVMTKT